MFVIVLRNVDLTPLDVFLYPLNSAPNKIHVQAYDLNRYQLSVSTAASNEVLIYETFNANETFAASEILKIDRIHAFLLNKYYAFGLLSSLNDDFMINELYNSMKKTVSIRVSSRKENTMNDSTLKVIDLSIPISSVVHLGFVDSFTNIFFLITASEIKIYSIMKPYIVFNAVYVDLAPPHRENDVYINFNYCVTMGNMIGQGDIMLFINHTNTLVLNNLFYNQFYFDLYDHDSYFYLDDVFLGPNAALTISSATESMQFYGPALPGFENQAEEVTLEVTRPIDNKVKQSIINVKATLQFATYATSHYAYRLHAIYIFDSKIE